MPLDRTTEAIAHFIGAFHMDVEALRLRDDYDAFRAAQGENDAPSDIPTFNISVRAPYDLKGFDPDLKLAPPAGPIVIVSGQAGVGASAQGSFDAAMFSRNMSPNAVPPPFAQSVGGAITYTWEVPPPNSIGTVTLQNLFLEDNDFLGFGLDYPFVDVAVFDAWLAELVGTAQALSLGLTELMPAGQVPTLDAALALAAQIDGLEAPEAEGATITLLTGADATGVIINGVQADEMPSFLDNLPPSLSSDDEDEAAEDTPPLTPFEDESNPYGVDPGHHVTTGGNLSANEALIATNWVDAGVIAVAGDVVSLNVISQVTVLAQAGGGGGAVAASQVVNAAQLVQTATSPEGEEEEAADAGPPVFPMAWQVTSVEGDVVLVNWVQQSIFASDNDSIEVMFTASATSIVMGENTLSNFTALIELGYHYDLIIVGGNMISINLVEQTMVLLDADTIAGSMAAGGAVNGGGNYLQNSASISTIGVDRFEHANDTFQAEFEALEDGAGTISAQLAADPLFEGLETLSVLYISGNLVEISIVQQTNYVGDADQVYLALQEFVAQGDGGVSVTTGENALLNNAQIVDVGIDSVVVAGGEVYSDALIYQAELIDTDAVPEGVAVSGLANEAVAFLASDMIDAPAEAEDGGGADLGADAGNLDVMQSMLA